MSNNGSRMRRVVRVLLVAGAVAVLGGMAALRLDDPTPSFAARRGQVAEVVRDAPTDSAGHRLEAVTVRSNSGMAASMLSSARPYMLGTTTGSSQPMALAAMSVWTVARRV